MTAEEIVNEFTARITKLDFDGAFELVAADIEYDNVPIGKVRAPTASAGCSRSSTRWASTRWSGSCTDRSRATPPC